MWRKRRRARLICLAATISSGAAQERNLAHLHQIDADRVVDLVVVAGDRFLLGFRIGFQLGFHFEFRFQFLIHLDIHGAAAGGIVRLELLVVEKIVLHAVAWPGGNGRSIWPGLAGDFLLLRANLAAVFVTGGSFSGMFLGLFLGGIL